MQFLLLPFAVLASLAWAGLQPLNLCLQNVNNEFFVVYSDNSGAGYGIAYSYYAEVCATFGLAVANLTAQQVPPLVTLAQTCMNTTVVNGFFNAYESIPAPYGCYNFDFLSVVFSTKASCTNGRYPVICQALSQPVATANVTTTVSTYATESLSSTETQTETSSTDGTTWQIIDNTVTVGTVTKTETVRPTHRHHDSSDSSSSHDHHHYSYNHHYRRRESKRVKTSKAARMAKGVYVTCPTTVNGFYLVHNTDRQPGDSIIDACNYVEAPIANLTTPILDNLVGLFSLCGVTDGASFGMNSPD